MTSFSITGVEGLPEINTGDDLAALILKACSLQDGDIVVVTSKVVSKSEGTLLESQSRDAAIAQESVRVVAQRGTTTISQTRHGFVMAAAGVDASNLPEGKVALLPVDSDESARRVRASLQESTGKNIAVLITDTFGRPWREGLVDQAVGCAGLQVFEDHRGKFDKFGNELHATITAIADELASASELVRSKLSQVPVAVISGLSKYVIAENGDGVSALIRKPVDDWFRLGHRETISSRRTIRDFTDTPVDDELVRAAISAAITAPAPHHSVPWRFAVVKSDEIKNRLLDEMTQAWRGDLERDLFDDASIDKRITRGAFLYKAPVLVIPCLVRDAAHAYRDVERNKAEANMFTLAGGAAIQNFLLFLNAEGLGTAWVSAALFCAPVVRRVLDLDATWEPLGTIAIGHPATTPISRSFLDIDHITRSY
jgi:coenzyme F420-0:L-glutamate ligase/coenzyme F420-1:gamma-L-glutamate ligase